MGVISRIAALVLTVASLALAQPGTALATGVPNDDFANATAISTLPFTDGVDNTTATTEPGETSGGCGSQLQQTVWYSITPASDTTVQIDMTGSAIFDPVFNIYRQQGNGLGGLVELQCAINPVILRLQANTTYYIQAGDDLSVSGKLHVNVQQIAAPPNDNFENAIAISPAALPFSDSETALAATVEPGEPTPSCASQRTISNSWWYSFTAPSTGSFTATSTNGQAVIATYTGSSLGDLIQTGCANGLTVVTIQATAGTTYHLQVNDNFGGEFGPLTLTFDHAPPPFANFSADISDPSTFDTVLFINESGDPARVGIARDEYNFGDGTTAAGCCADQTGIVDASHQYAKDGDYTATQTVTTFDGRTASTSQTVHVSTHDVAIAAFTVPASARPGKTRLITVSISDKRYPETVQVDLFRSDPQNGSVLVGSLTQSVLVKSGKRTTIFTFSYTFTSDDAAVGKVAFFASATIENARDAFTADNSAFASTAVR
jgi:hypothetical protein